MIKLKTFVCLFLLCVCYATQAQARLGNYQIRVVPDRDNWTYELNQPAKFTVSVTLDNHQISGLSFKYSCGLEAMPTSIEKTVVTTAQTLTIEAGTLDKPGFLRCVATMETGGRTYRGLGTAGFRPDLIKPTTDDPKDFDQFWEDGKKELAKLPIDAKFEPLFRNSSA